MGAQNPYAVLGLPSTANDEAIQEAWARSLKQARKGGHYSIEEINNARNTLTDPDARAQLDLELFPDVTFDRECELEPVPENPSLYWIEGAFKWRWVTNHDSLSDYRPNVPLPTEQALWESYPEYRPRFFMRPIEEWLFKYAREAQDPWEND